MGSSRERRRKRADASELEVEELSGMIEPRQADQR